VAVVEAAERMNEPSFSRNEELLHALTALDEALT
jgi:hypothetical protein